MLNNSINKIEVINAGKVYHLYKRPIDRLLQILLPVAKPRHEVFVALENVSFTVKQSEVLGVIGVNGAGKSTLLQLIAGTLNPSFGEIKRQGRIASILELGAGFNPDFTGFENIYLNAATMGLSKAEIDKRLEDIIDFSGIRQHIHHPVKTYSSGMLIRLAFSVASSFDPDVLIIDEALSVGDGAFRRRSFDRIMEIKQKGTTIIFCSHVMFHIETFCDRVIWLHKGKVQQIGNVNEVLSTYQTFIDAYEQDANIKPEFLNNVNSAPELTIDTKSNNTFKGEAQILSLQILLDNKSGYELTGTKDSILEVNVTLGSDPDLPAPTVALVISSDTGKILASKFSLTDSVNIQRGINGRGSVQMKLNPLNLNKGKYRIGVYLFCERAMHGYAMMDPAAVITIEHSGADKGFMLLPVNWLSESVD